MEVSTEVVKSLGIAKYSISPLKSAPRSHLSIPLQPIAALLPSKTISSSSSVESIIRASIKTVKLSKCIPVDNLGIQLKIIDG